MNSVPRTDLQIVLDTNVYISAFTNSQGVPFRVWRQAICRSYKLLVSPPIVAELAGVLRRRFDWDDARVIRRIKLLTAVAEIVTPAVVLTVFKGVQEADNRILECAIAGHADLIVSGDRDLLRLKAYNGITIVRPVDALRTLGGS